jgi:lipid II:glycine glycyltransferase (peptidoglycan interpeptide bridge formation enzyme)
MVGWGLAYIPRGPIGDLDDPEVRAAMEAALLELAAEERIGLIRVDPERGPDDPFGRALLSAPWQAAPKVQPPMTRLIDLRRPESELRADLRAKHRQYVAKAARAGVTVESFDPAAGPEATAAALADFSAIYRDTARRARFAFRVDAYYRRVWDTFAPSGRARLFFAVQDGVRVAALFHLLCGDRVAEVYGGMLPAAADSRANYLLKWEAIRAFQAAGLATYDLWGLATGGIRQFKEGFGGAEVPYVGARQLVTSARGAALITASLPLHAAVQRLRARRDRIGGSTSD